MRRWPSAKATPTPGLCTGGLIADDPSVTAARALPPLPPLRVPAARLTRIFSRLSSTPTNDDTFRCISFHNSASLSPAPCEQPSSRSRRKMPAMFPSDWCGLPTIALTTRVTVWLDSAGEAKLPFRSSQSSAVETKKASTVLECTVEASRPNRPAGRERVAFSVISSGALWLRQGPIRRIL